MTRDVRNVEVELRYSLALLAAVLSTGCKGPAEPDVVHHETIRVSGQVTSTDGTPLRGARIKLYSTECPGCTLTEGEVITVVYGRDSSDADGQYRIVAEEAKCSYDVGPLLEATYGRRIGVEPVACMSELQVIDITLSE